MTDPRSGATLLPLFSPEEIDGAIRRLACELNADYAGKALHLLIALKGAFIFAGDLVRHLNLPVTMDFIRVASYSGTEPNEGINLAMPTADSLSGRNVLIVEDILDTGRSLEFLTRYVMAAQPQTLKSCVLVNKTGRRRTALEPDYCGLPCSSGFLVGYGLDCDEQFRNLPGIFEMES
jgi:hypoxanthine phosphoribosyltransferase